MSRLFCSLSYEAFRPIVQCNQTITRDIPRITLIQVRTKYVNNRHRDPKYRKERGRKTWIPLDLPDFDQVRKESQANLTPDQIRAKLKEKGVVPPRPYEEREVYNPCTISIQDPYNPFDGDGKSSSLIDKLKAPLSTGADIVKNRRSLSAIRSYEGEEFELDDFARKSVDIYKKAHELIAAGDENEIYNYVTEHCYPLMTAGMNRNTIIWKYLDEIEPPKVVQVRAPDLVQKGNKYAQITVRFHSKQIMAAFDRHGRLILGSPTDVREVLEYIVFEKYLANEYGLWRIHERIRGKQSEAKPIVMRTRANQN